MTPAMSGRWPPLCIASGVSRSSWAHRFVCESRSTLVNASLRREPALVHRFAGPPWYIASGGSRPSFVHRLEREPRSVLVGVESRAFVSIACLAFQPSLAHGVRGGWAVAEGGGCPAQPKPEPGILAIFGRCLMAVAEARDAPSANLPLRNRLVACTGGRASFCEPTTIPMHLRVRLYCTVPGYVVSLLGGKEALRELPPSRRCL
jgi:hypothetical protein